MKRLLIKFYDYRIWYRLERRRLEQDGKLVPADWKTLLDLRNRLGINKPKVITVYNHVYE